MKRTPRQFLGIASSVFLMVALSACASSAPGRSRPRPFPNAPVQRWAEVAGPGHVAAMSAILETATALKGIRYRNGGTTPSSGFDCSGFVRYVFGQSRLDVPRTVAEQFIAGQEVAPTFASAGDLVFFSTLGPGATHVGIVVDPVQQTFVHAPGTGSVVRIERFDTPYWRSRMLGIRRLAATVPSDARATFERE